MIRDTDVRIDNLVYYCHVGGKLQEVSIGVEWISSMYRMPECFHPIPITPKLLVDRCGMSEGDGTFNSLSTTDGTINIIRAYIPNGGYVFCYQGIKIPLQGLHHLQNVFYFLLGYELPITTK